jgi:high-affinity iron transporter
MVAAGMWLRISGALAAVVALFVVGSSLAYAATPQQDITNANAVIQRALTTARANDLSAARAAYDQYENSWFDIEDGVRASSRDSYVAMEKAMTGISNAFAATPPVASQVVSALTALDREQQAFLSGQASTAKPNAEPEKATIGSVLDLLSDAQAALARNDYATASARLTTFEADWLAVEGEVKTRSPEDYRQTENDMALAASLAGQNSPQAVAVVNRLATRLEPYRAAQQYGIFDAAIILLREGLEALLVIVALSAVLKRSGTRAGQAWLWSGAAGGLLLSIGLGLAIQAFFGAVINPSNREVIEGVIGLGAAAMLIYVSYWLHSKASLGGWQKYISQQTSHALNGGRLLGLAVLAFLAVFREGAETALFYLGMVSSISNSDLLVGLGLGFVGLAGLGFLMVVVGVRIPMRPFFAVASLLVFYLCFKFIGTGIHALQLAGLIPTGTANFLPTVDVVGVYPTWPTTTAQLVLLIAAAWVVLRERARGVGRSSAAMSAAVLLVLGGCTSAPPSAAPAAPTQAAVPAAPVLTSTRQEAGLVAGPRRRLEELASALQKADFPAARAALEAYNAEWNGIEVYVNVRSRALYGEIETHYEADITKALQDPKPNAAQILLLVQSMVGQYDEAIKLSDASAPLSPLFDDLAAVRTVRAPLRTVSPALKSGDVSKASAGFAEFKTRWPTAQPQFAARSADADQEITAALAAADKAMSTDPAHAGPQVDGSLERFNYGVNLLNAAARGADPNKATFSADDMQLAARLGKTQNELRDSLARWEGGARPQVREAPDGVDAAVNTAVSDAYAALADPAADAARVRATNKAAIEALAIRQQAVVGQFWTDAPFRAAYQAAIATN